MNQENQQSNENNVNIIPEYTLIKKVLLQQYYTAQSCLTDYDLKPNINNEKRVRQALISLSRSLQFKSYILTNSDLKKLFNNFISSPQLFSDFSLHLIFSINSLILELLGLTKVESEDMTKENVFSEV